MSKALDKARQQFQAGRDKQAVNTLYEVASAPDAPPDEVAGLLELATAIRARNAGALQTECDAHIRRARQRAEADQESRRRSGRRGRPGLAAPVPARGAAPSH